MPSRFPSYSKPTSANGQWRRSSGHPTTMTFSARALSKCSSSFFSRTPIVFDDLTWARGAVVQGVPGCGERCAASPSAARAGRRLRSVASPFDATGAAGLPWCVDAPRAPRATVGFALAFTEPARGSDAPHLGAAHADARHHPLHLELAQRPAPAPPARRGRGGSARREPGARARRDQRRAGRGNGA
jgi:hypothetical protein